MSKLVDFQKKLFEHIDELHRIGEEDQYIRFVSNGLRFILNTTEISGAYLLPRVIAIPSAPKSVVGAVQVGGQVWTLFDFATICDSEKRSVRTGSSKVLTLSPHLAPGIALLVDQTFSLVPQRLFYDSGECFYPAEWAKTTLLNDEDGSSWTEIDPEVLLNGSSFVASSVLSS